MNELNPYILLVIRWLYNSDSVSKEQLQGNAKAAYAAAHNADYSAAYAVAHNADYSAAYAVAHAAFSAAYYAASIHAKHWLRKTKKHLNKYFELTKEDRQEYEQRIKYLSVLGANND